MNFNFWKNKSEPSIGVPISFVEAKPSITVSQAVCQPIEESRTAIERILDVRVPEKTLQEYTRGGGALSGTLAAVWSTTADTKRDFIQLSKELRKFYIYEALLDVVTDDVLNPDIDGKILDISSTSDEFKDDIEEVVDKIELDTYLHDIVRDTIDYGEYAIKLESETNKGVTGISDTVDQMNVLAMYSGARPSKYMIMKSGQFIVAPPNQYAHFLAGSKKIRYRLDNVAHYYNTDSAGGIPPADTTQLPNEIKKDLPDFIRVGQPMFRGMASKIRDLQLLEQLIPAIKLNQLTQSKFISVKMPTSVDPQNVMKILQRYEDILNIPVGIDVNKARITLAEIMSATQKVRVFPDFSDGKGQMNQMDIRSDQSVDDILNAIEDIRNIISTSLGIPPSILFGATENRAAELRKYSRYVKRIQMIRHSIKRAVEHIVLCHLALKGKRATAKDIKIRFVNSLVDVAELEQMELDDSKQAIMRNTIQTANEIQANPVCRATIHAGRFAKWLRKSFEPVMHGESFFMTDEEMEANMDKIMAAFQEPIQVAAAPGSNSQATANGSDGDSNTSPGSSNQKEIEQHVLLLLKQGKTQKEIALTLNLDSEVVGKIMQKLKRSERHERNSKAS